MRKHSVLMAGSIFMAGCLGEKSLPSESDSPGGVLAAAATGFKTAKPAYLVPTAPGVVVDPILSTGDIVGTYQMSGHP